MADDETGGDESPHTQQNPDRARQTFALVMGSSFTKEDIANIKAGSFEELFEAADKLAAAYQAILDDNKDSERKNTLLANFNEGLFSELERRLEENSGSLEDEANNGFMHEQLRTLAQYNNFKLLVYITKINATYQYCVSEDFDNEVSTWELDENGLPVRGETKFERLASIQRYCGLIEETGRLVTSITGDSSIGTLNIGVESEVDDDEGLWALDSGIALLELETELNSTNQAIKVLQTICDEMPVDDDFWNAALECTDNWEEEREDSPLNKIKALYRRIFVYVHTYDDQTITANVNQIGASLKLIRSKNGDRQNHMRIIRDMAIAIKHSYPQALRQLSEKIDSLEQRLRTYDNPDQYLTLVVDEGAPNDPGL